MNRSDLDQWSLGQGLTASITSHFTLPIENGHSTEIDKGVIHSTNCGLGWRFAVVATNADTELGDETAGNVMIPLRKTRYELLFDPHIINKTELKNLTITTTTHYLTPLSQKHDPTKVVVIPTVVRPRLYEKVSLGQFKSDENFTGHATIIFRVELPITFNLSLPAEPPSLRVQHVLGDSLMGHDLIDTKFVLFTSRNREHQPAKPQALFGNSRLLRGFSAYLDTLLEGGGYRESQEVDLGSDIFEDIPTDGYDYLSDSDLDSDSEDEVPPVPSPVPPLHFPVGTPPDDRIPPSDDIILPSGDKESVTEEASPNRWAETQAVAMPPVSQNSGKLGRRITLNDTAFKTWRSLLFYLYTGKLEFTPLGKTRRHMPQFMSSDSLACSPKSMFRLADKIDLPELQLLALSAIRRSLNKHNVVDEIFSRFTSMYPKVQEIEIEFLTTNLTPDVFQRCTQKLKLVVAGGLPHSFDILSDLFHKMCTGDMRVLLAEERKSKKKGRK